MQNMDQTPLIQWRYYNVGAHKVWVFPFKNHEKIMGLRLMWVGMLVLWGIFGWGRYDHGQQRKRHRDITQFHLKQIQKVHWERMVTPQKKWKKIDAYFKSKGVRISTKEQAKGVYIVTVYSHKEALMTALQKFKKWGVDVRQLSYHKKGVWEMILSTNIKLC